MTIKVCVGSSCHLKGSYNVIESFKEILKKYDVEDLVELQASFCFGACDKSVTIRCDNDSHDTATATPIEGGLLLHRVNSDNAEEIFVKEVYPLLGL